MHLFSFRKLFCDLIKREHFRVICTLLELRWPLFLPTCSEIKASNLWGSYRTICADNRDNGSGEVGHHFGCTSASVEAASSQLSLKVASFPGQLKNWRKEPGIHDIKQWNTSWIANSTLLATCLCHYSFHNTSELSHICESALLRSRC